MTDDKKYAGLKKLRSTPAARLLSAVGMKLDAKVQSPPDAPPAVVLAELDELSAPLDALKLLSLALPAREGVWWACLAWRDILGPEGGPAPLRAAEAWVYKPGDAAREAAQKAIDEAERDDDTVFCAMAALYSDGKLGPGDMAEYDAAIGASGLSVHAAVIRALFDARREGDAPERLLIDRALDIARGGSGRVEAGGAQAKRESEAGTDRKDVA